MKMIIAGGRNILDRPSLLDVLSTIPSFSSDPLSSIITEVVSGGAAGVDHLGEQWAQDISIPVRIFKAEWAAYGRAAGPLRNREMATYADGLVLIWNGRSKGSANMRKEALSAGIVVFEKIIS